MCYTKWETADAVKKQAWCAILNGKPLTEYCICRPIYLLVDGSMVNWLINWWNDCRINWSMNGRCWHIYLLLRLSQIGRLFHFRNLKAQLTNLTTVASIGKLLHSQQLSFWCHVYDVIVDLELADVSIVLARDGGNVVGEEPAIAPLAVVGVEGHTQQT